MTHLVRLQFGADGPAVTGQWADGATARRTWRDWVGLYGSGEYVVIRLTDDADGNERLLIAWEQGRLIATESDGGHRSES
ncbi:hypothetical protein AB0I98_47365 [Streptomyces sp. NPDC050211]|uniref:hypothetical protein n=1 Tax=Streptomyces sp. NPDC050211 TaxID=3154932 RepID=UPI00341AD6D8